MKRKETEESIRGSKKKYISSLPLKNKETIKETVCRKRNSSGEYVFPKKQDCIYHEEKWICAIYSCDGTYKSPVNSFESTYIS